MLHTKYQNTYQSLCSIFTFMVFAILCKMTMYGNSKCCTIEKVDFDHRIVARIYGRTQNSHVTILFHFSSESVVSIWIIFYLPKLAVKSRVRIRYMRIVYPSAIKRKMNVLSNLCKICLL